LVDSIDRHLELPDGSVQVESDLIGLAFLTEITLLSINTLLGLPKVEGIAYLVDLKIIYISK